MTPATRWLLWTTVVLLPLLEPRGPGQSAPVDAVAVVYAVVALAGLGRAGKAVRIPAGGPFLLIAAASLLATTSGLNLQVSMLSLLVEAYLFLLLAAVASDLDGDRGGLAAVLAVWSAAGLAWATLLVGLRLGALPGWLRDTLFAGATEGARAAGAAGNPNLAAGYLMTTLFVLLASPWPRRRPRRALAAAWLLVGVFVTGSNGALLGTAAGLAAVVVGAALRRCRTPRQRLGLAGAVAVAGVLALGTLAVTGDPVVRVTDVRALAQRERQGAFAGTLGRLDRSVGERLTLWAQAWDAAGGRVLVGVGPGAATDLPVATRTLRRGLHNDYYAFLIERGVLGLAGLLALMAVLLARTGRLLVARLPDGRGSWWAPAGLGGAVVANLVLATNHETFHFRHLWVALGLVWAASRQAPPAAPAVPSEPALEELAHAGR